MSKQILLIQVNAIGEGEQKKIEFEITDQIGNITEKLEITDDGKESFAKLTTSLTKCMKGLQQNLPHKVVGMFGSKVVVPEGSGNEEDNNEKPVEKEKGEEKEKQVEPKKTFDIENSNIVSPFKEMLIKLRDKNVEKSEEVLSRIDSIVDKIVDEKEFMGDKPAIKTYNKEKLKADETIFLGLYTIDDKPQREVFLTKDGIITDGFAILPINAKGLTGSGDSITITDPGGGLFGGYIRCLKMANANKTNTAGISGEKEYDVAVKELKGKGSYDSGLANVVGGKTASKKGSQQRKTRRNRH